MPEEWYFTQEGQQVGPISREQLNKLASSGRLAPEELVWRDGMADWVPARSVPGLFAPRKQAAPSSTAVQTYEHTERSRSRADDEEDDERYEERRRERKKKKKKKKKKGGMAPGLKIGLITGGGVLGALLLLVFILFVVVPLFSGDGSIRGSYEVSVPPGQTHTKTIRFEKGMWVTIKISNQSLGMWDVLVVDPSGSPVTLFGDRKVAAPNVYFEASADGDYQITVANLSLAPGNDEVSYEGTRKKKI